MITINNNKAGGVNKRVHGGLLPVTFACGCTLQHAAARSTSARLYCISPIDQLNPEISLVKPFWLQRAMTARRKLASSWLPQWRESKMMPPLLPPLFMSMAASYVRAITQRRNTDLEVTLYVH